MSILQNGSVKHEYYIKATRTRRGDISYTPRKKQEACERQGVCAVETSSAQRDLETVAKTDLYTHWLSALFKSKVSLMTGSAGKSAELLNASRNCAMANSIRRRPFLVPDI